MTGNKLAASWQWNSPLPYLFGGLGLMFALICVALLILACSYWKRSPSVADDEEKSVKPAQSPAPVSMVPQIVVIMAGDENPTHLAVPVLSSSSSSSSSKAPYLCANCNSGHHHNDGGDDAAGEASPSAMQLV